MLFYDYHPMFESSTAKKYLKKQGAESILHVKEGSLFDHLCRVEKTLLAWGAEPSVCSAGLFHSIYSTENLKVPLVEDSQKEEVQMLLGEEAEHLVSLFPKIDRNSFLSNTVSGPFEAHDREEKSSISLTKKEFIGLLHIFLANELDHITPLEFESAVARCNSFAPFNDLLLAGAQEELSKINTDTGTSGSNLRFIGHAGVWFTAKETSLVIDPWLYSSNTRHPILLGLYPGQRTIDYLIPRPVHTAVGIAPSIILISHLHTHHSPLREIVEFVTLTPVHIVCPPIPDPALQKIKEFMGPDRFKKITFHFVEKDTELFLGSVRIFAFTHTKKEHLGFLVNDDTTSFMHLTDTRANTEKSKMDLDPLWEKLAFKNPNYLFISAANHSQRTLQEEARNIEEHATLSPTQAAKLCLLINPKCVGLIGMYNFSVWDSAIEYAHSPQDIENEFAWALRYLAPSIQIETLRPGTRCQLG